MLAVKQPVKPSIYTVVYNTLFMVLVNSCKQTLLFAMQLSASQCSTAILAAVTCYLFNWGSYSSFLSHDQDAIHTEKGCVEMMISPWCFVQVMGKKQEPMPMQKSHIFQLGAPLKWKPLGLLPHAFQALVMHLVGKCVISAWAWVLPIVLKLWKNCANSRLMLA